MSFYLPEFSLCRVVLNVLIKRADSSVQGCSYRLQTVACVCAHPVLRSHCQACVDLKDIALEPKCLPFLGILNSIFPLFSLVTEFIYWETTVGTLWIPSYMFSSCGPSYNHASHAKSPNRTKCQLCGCKQLFFFAMLKRGYYLTYRCKKIRTARTYFRIWTESQARDLQPWVHL